MTEDDGVNCSYKTCKAPVKSSPKNQHYIFKNFAVKTLLRYRDVKSCKRASKSL